MAYEYKWYIIKINYGCEEDVRELVKNNDNYFKDVFIPYQTVCNTSSGTNDLRDIYVYMYLCDESKQALQAISSLDKLDDFRVVSSDEVESQRKCKWYILRVASNYEEKVREHIENSMRLGMENYFKEVCIPYEELNEMESVKNRKAATRKKCFPGYVFLHVNLCDEVLNFINNIPKSLKVYGFLKNGNVPKVISENEIRSMFNALCDAKETKKLNSGYEKGQEVKVSDGPFQGFNGTIETVDNEKRMVKVQVSIWSRTMTIDLDLAQVEKKEE